MHSHTGKYIVIDGIDRVGKGTLINTIKDFELSRNKRIFDIDQYQTLRQEGPVSQRRTIVIKGYQHWAGRALVALKAVDR